MRKIYLLKFSLKIFFVILTCLCFSSSDVFAQHTVSGTVKDAAGNGLAGATIIAKGKRISTTSNTDGSFTIAVPDNNSVLVVSYVGYLAQEIRVGSSTSFDIALQPGSTELNQVVHYRNITIIAGVKQESR